MSNEHPPAQDFQLEGLISWLFRRGTTMDRPRNEALQPIFESARTNLYAVDGIISTIATATYGAGAAPWSIDPTVTIEMKMRSGLQMWQRHVEHVTKVMPMVMPGRPLPWLAIEGLLSTLLVQAWTTFEAFATDTWVTALNEHPAILAELRGKQRGNDAEARSKDLKKIDLSWLQRHDYDVSRRMGNVLRNRFSFDSLRGIREAYRAAFAVDSEAILTPLENEALTAVSAVRNVLVHRAGKADDEYVKITKAIPLAPKASIGSKIPLDGANVAEMLLTGRTLAVDMFRAVDDWLFTHA